MTKVTKLKNGLTIISTKKKVDGVSLEVLVKTGQINETDKQNGISHFLEHMAFKGTKDKTAQELSESIESLGGYCNAYTAYDHTVYHVNILAKYWKVGLNFLSDIVLHSVFPEDELERERKVILQEIARSKDNPERVFWDKLTSTIYKGQALSRTVLGPASNVKSFTKKDLQKYVKDNYCPNNMIVSVCGNISHRKLVKAVKELFGHLTPHKVKDTVANKFVSAQKSYNTIFEQALIGMLFEGLPYDSKERPVYEVFKNILDGGMSCRLFQVVREKNGLCYSTSIIEDSIGKSGFFGVYAGIKKENIDKCFDCFEKVLESMKTCITDDELTKAKNILLYNLAMAESKCASVMAANAESYMYTGKPMDYKRTKKEIEAVTKQQVFDFAKKYIYLGKQSRVIVTSKKED